MKKFIFLAVGAFALFFLGGCVESSQKYKALVASYDSLSTTYATQNQEMESLFAGLNDISSGMQSIREAENLLSIDAVTEGGNSSKSQKQVMLLKNDIQAISNAITSYKEQISKLEGKNVRQSAEFKKMIAGLNEELERRAEKITEFTKQLEEKEKQLGIKTQQIVVLNENVANLNKETASQKETISNQDEAIHTVNYLLGSRKALKEANVISRQGLFCPPIVSSQAQKAKFISVDMREVKSIPMNVKKAKVLSAHPADSYTLEAGTDGMLTLQINNPESFWKQTKFLVVMVSE